MSNDGIRLDTEEDIEAEVVSYFSNLFQSDLQGADTDPVL